MGWVSPTSHTDHGDWWFESSAYDDDTNTSTTENIAKESWGGFLDLIRAEISCNKVQFYAFYSHASINKIDLDVYWNDAWHDIYEGSYLNEEWVEKELGGTYAVTQARVKFYNNHSSGSYLCYLYEFEFNEAEAPPPPTYIPKVIMVT